MWTYHPELLATPVPRYTSFPTAAEFHSRIVPADLANAIEAAEGDVSLYLHIPFCERICWYCGCNTGAANRHQRLSSYLDALHREITLVAERLPASARIRRIAFGGGSPNAIAPHDFVRLFDSLVLNFAIDNPTVSIELDPRTLSGGWETVIGAVGATHASLGVQTFSQRLQEAIGRVQPIGMIESSVQLLREAGITSLNFDLMYGLPGQSENDLAETLDRATAFGADRIALFGYAHVPHLIPRQRRIDATALPDQQQRFAMAEQGYRQLVQAEYQPIGFDHFALPQDPLAQAAQTGQLRRNFQGFTDDQAPVLIGLGASAISKFPGVLVQNEKNSGRYRMLLSQDMLPAAHGIERSADDQRRGEVIEQLLCQGRAPVNGDLLAQTADRLEPFMREGLCRIEDGQLQLAPSAVPYARSIAAQFDPYRQHSPRRFSSAV
ncbi:oxygen-independent coproporphyrinogen III oxidase [Altericroceibacterium xinjiangense]|uniref:oxygen-independent coproporphyrinogen III oxidase n=1 Tax=Altericroceibacterium xinjiangense TaxID=762261 RepID=UPI000F7DBE74|nr:oxygen-independent coproporphyrinogen III oxidase [Altericroceibacterium xinjiangense]